MSESADGEQEPDKGSVGLLAQVFPREVVDAAIGRAGVKELRDRVLPARLMVYFVIGMWLWPGIGYIRVLKKVTAGLRWTAADGDRCPLPYDGSVAKARARLGEAVFDVKPTPANLAAFAMPAGGVLPQVRLVAFAGCGTMALLGAAFDSIEIGERELVMRLLGRFAPGMLVLADRGFPSFELWRDAAATGADLAWRVSASFALPVVEVLSDGSYLSRLRGRKKKDIVTVRVAEFSVKDADTGISEVFALITTLLDPVAYPASSLAGLYAARWQVELLFKILKV